MPEGLEARIEGDRMSLSDCEMICQALKSFGEDSYSDEKTFSWSGTIVNEFVRATTNALEKRQSTKWHRYAEGSRSRGIIREEDKNFSPLQVVQAKWLHHSISQSCPVPFSNNVITVGFSTNVPLGPAREGGSKESLCWLQISGLHMFVPPDAEDPSIELGGVNANLFCDAADSERGGRASWDSSGFFLLFLRGVLGPHKKHFLELHVKNPALPVSLDEVKLEVLGCVEIDPVLLINVNASEPDTNGLDVYSKAEKCFIQAWIHADTNFPGSLNTITISFALNHQVGKGARVLISGLNGYATEDDNELQMSFASGKENSASLARTGVWNREHGTVEVEIVHDIIGGERCSFSFKLQNPSRSRHASPPFISIVGSDAQVPFVELRYQEPQDGPLSSPGDGRLEPSEAIFQNARYDWYETFEAHLRLQYPDLYANKQEESQRLREKFIKLEPSLRVGISHTWTVACTKAEDGAVDVAWRPFLPGNSFPSSSSSHRRQSVFFVQVSDADAQGNASNFRTVFAGPAASCRIPSGFCPPVSRKTCVRMREECRDEEGVLVTSSWNYAYLEEDEEKTSNILALSSFLSWSPSQCDPSMVIGNGGKSVRRRPMPGWGAALGEKRIAGTVRWRFSFSGRVDLVAVGIAEEDMPLDVSPHSEGLRWHDRTHTADKCIVWMWDGSMVSRGTRRSPSLRRHGPEFAICIEGDHIEVRVNAVNGWVEFLKEEEVLLRERVSLQGSSWFPYAGSGSSCAILLEEVDAGL